MESPETQVVIKGEVHSSRDDLEKELELIKQGFDVLVLEGAEGDPEYTLSGLWYYVASAVTFWLLDRTYQSENSLIHVAEAKDIEVVRTRKSDADVLKNASWLVRLVALTAFFVVTFGGLFTGLYSNFLLGYGLTMLGIILPPIYLRRQNMTEAAGEHNRDKLMADTIVEAARDGKSVLAVVGASHTDGVRTHLPDNIGVTYYPPENTIKSRQFFRSMLVDFGEFLLLSLGLYFVIIHLTSYVIGILA